MISTVLLPLVDCYYMSQIIGVIVVGFTVIVSVKTFRKISKQTESVKEQTDILQEQLNFNKNAALRIAIKNVSSVDENVHIVLSDTSKHDKICKLVRDRYPETPVLMENDYIVIEVTNHGFSDVCKLNLKVSIDYDISSLSPDSPKDNISGEFDWNELIKNDPKPTVFLLSPCFAFPKYKVTVSGSYEDTRDKCYTLPIKEFSGKPKDFDYAYRLASTAKKTSIDKTNERNK